MMMMGWKTDYFDKRNLSFIVQGPELTSFVGLSDLSRGKLQCYLLFNCNPWFGSSTIWKLCRAWAVAQQDMIKC